MPTDTEQRPTTTAFVPERAQEAGGAWHAGPVRARTRQLPSPVRRVLRSKVVELATTPHGPEPWLRMINPLWSLSSTRALLVERRRETHDVTTLVFDAGPGWGPQRAGQHVRLDLGIDGRRYTRYFSISSAPAEGDSRHFTLTVKAHDDGLVSRFLQTHARLGLVVEVSDPRGEFVLPDPRPSRLLLVSGGSGITPVMSMLRQLVAEDAPTEVVFVHYARAEEDRIFADELDQLDREHDRVTVVTSMTRGAPPEGMLEGRLAVEHLKEHCPDWTSLPAFVCGPPAMLETAEQLWEEHGAADHLHVERFTFAAPSDTEGGGGTVRLVSSDVEIEDDGRPLLMQAEDAGLKPDFGCRMGICKTCTVRKVSGTTQNLASGDVSRDDDQDIQICVSVAVGDAELAL